MVLIALMIYLRMPAHMTVLIKHVYAISARLVKNCIM